MQALIRTQVKRTFRRSEVRTETLKSAEVFRRRVHRMSRRIKVPSYRLHKQSGQAIVTLTDGLGNRRDVLLGRYETPESRTEYARVILEWETSGRRLPAKSAEIPAPPDLSVNELALTYWKWAEAYYGFTDRRKGTSFNLKDVLRIL